MLITLEEKKQITVEIEFPAYYKWTDVYIKILSEKEVIQVKDYSFTFGISKEDSYSLSIPMMVSSGKRITQEEFCEAFERVGEKVKRELIKAIETDGWKAQEQAELQANALAEVETTQS